MSNLKNFHLHLWKGTSVPVGDVPRYLMDMLVSCGWSCAAERGSAGGVCGAGFCLLCAAHADAPAARDAARAGQRQHNLHSRPHRRGHRCLSGACTPMLLLCSACCHPYAL
jgi:hypothetical protein